MLTTTLRHVKSNLVAYLALFAALGGTSYAAVTINGSQIQNRTINPSKFNPRWITGNTRAWAIVRPNGTLIAGAGHPKVTAGFYAPGSYGVKWGVKIGRCATDVTIDASSSPPTERVAIPGNASVPFTAGYAVAASSSRVNSTSVQTFNQAGQPTPLGFGVAVIC